MLIVIKKKNDKTLCADEAEYTNLIIRTCFSCKKKKVMFYYSALVCYSSRLRIQVM